MQPEIGEGGDPQLTLVTDAAAEASLSSDGRSLLKRIVIYVPGSIVPAMLTLATSVIFTRIFDPVAYGKYSLFLVYAAPIELLFIQWLNQSIGKFLPPARTRRDRRRVKEAIFLSIALIFVSEIVLAAGAIAAGDAFLAPEWRSFLLPTALFIIISSLFDLNAIVFAAEYRAKEYTFYQLLDSVATFALRLVLVTTILSGDIRLMFWSVIISHGFLLPVMWARVGFPRPRQLARVLRSSEIRDMARIFLAFGLPMTVFFISSVLLDVGDRYVLNFLKGPGPVGVYDANYRLIAGVVVLMVVPVTITLHPYLMRVAGSGDSALIERAIGLVVENLLLMGMLTVGLTFLLHADIARIVLGREFRAGSVVMPPVVAGVFLFNIGTFAHKPFEIVGRTRVMLVFGVISAAANLGLCFALIPALGYVGAAYATLLSYLIYTACVGYLGRRIFPWRVNPRRLTTYGGIIAAGLIAIHFLRGAMSGLPYGWSLAVTVLASCALAALCLLAVLRPMLKRGWQDGSAGLPTGAGALPRRRPAAARRTGRHRRGSALRAAAARRQGGTATQGPLAASISARAPPSPRQSESPRRIR
jgi:O-antigen/teichoic acid export membrane protein